MENIAYKIKNGYSVPSFWEPQNALVQDPFRNSSSRQLLSHTIGFIQGNMRRAVYNSKVAAARLEMTNVW